MAEDARSARSSEDLGVGADVDVGLGEGQAAPGASPDRPGKRKREMTPATEREEAELARRRRRRQSLVFQQRRKSLTRSVSGEDGSNRQYITDMYSTIIKMSSENKINIKNSWSLHLIDHMEDILSSPQKEVDRPGEDTNTFNFQKASCTLDASVKIYSYRVDDTWTSSYKILENLSRTGNDKRKDADDDDDEDNDEDGEQSANKKKKAASRKSANAARTIEKNIKNISLKNYEIEFEPDPLFHKMSQTFDEGGAKGMLLANLGVYDGSKILLNSADVKLSTRKPTSPISSEGKQGGVAENSTKEGDEESPQDEESEPTSTTVDMSALGKLSCFTRDILPLGVCPPIRRLYSQIDELRGNYAAQKKVIMHTKVLHFEKDDGLSDDGLASASVDDGGMSADEGMIPRPVGTHTDDDNSSVEENDFEPDVDMDVDTASVNGDAGGENAASVDGDDAVSVVDSVDHDYPTPLEGTIDEGMEGDISDDEEDMLLARNIDPIAKLEDRQPQIKSAADYFRLLRDDDIVKKEEDSAYSQLIETALMRSAADAQPTGEDQNDYSYFDTKVLKNWAGPAHWKIKGTPRKPSAKLLMFGDDVNGDDDTKQSDKQRKTTKKRATAAAEKRSLLIDFMSTDALDLDALLKPPAAASTITMSARVVEGQLKKSSELVLPVDAHIEPQIFFRHFMKPRLQLFQRRRSSRMSTASTLGPPRFDTFSASGGGNPIEFASRGDGADDGLGNDYSSHDFDGGHYSDHDSAQPDELDDGTLYSGDGLVTAERVVEKIDVHYERFAKRVDIKKLKTSIWGHLEKATSQTDKQSRKRGPPQVETDEVDKDVAAEEPGTTTFSNMVENVAGEVPSNVTVSFYFMCVLHLANEKGLRLSGQDDLTNFEIVQD